MMQLREGHSSYCKSRLPHCALASPSAFFQKVNTICGPCGENDGSGFKKKSQIQFPPIVIYRQTARALSVPRSTVRFHATMNFVTTHVSARTQRRHTLWLHVPCPRDMISCRQQALQLLARRSADGGDTQNNGSATGPASVSVKTPSLSAYQSDLTGDEEEASFLFSVSDARLVFELAVRREVNCPEHRYLWLRSITLICCD